MTDALTQFYDYRWSCPKCARFIAASSVIEEDWADNGAYYGVSTRITGRCGKCGPVDEPIYKPTRWADLPPIEDDPVAMRLGIVPDKRCAPRGQA